jgi:hypothetical protein
MFLQLCKISVGRKKEERAANRRARNKTQAIN